MCYRMEFIKIPLHTEHMYSPEEVEEKDLWCVVYSKLSIKHPVLSGLNFSEESLLTRLT